MKEYLYKHWAESTIFMAVAISLVLFSFFSVTPWYLFLIWFQFPVYLIHEFEEHVYPGHFREFINREIFQTNKDDVPLSIPAVFWINILAIWILFPLAAIAAQNLSPEWGVLLPVFGLFNASLHILFFFIKRRYNPGLIISVFLNYPTGVYTLWILAQAGFITGLSLTYALTVTVLSHAIIILFVKNKLPRGSLQR